MQDRVRPFCRVVVSLAMWLFLLVLVVCTVLALGSIDAPLQSRPLHQLPFSALDGRDVGDVQAAELESRSLVRGYNTMRTGRAEHPFWLRFSVVGLPTATASIEFPSRHAQTVTCWDSANLRTPVGGATRSGTSGAMEVSKAGFALPMHAVGSGDLLCQQSFVGPANVSILVWDTATLAQANRTFSRAVDLLNASLMTLALCVAFIAIRQREWMFFLLSAWLIGNLRLAAISGGWDMQWLGMEIPAEWLSRMRKLTYAAYLVLTVALFRCLFAAELQGARVRRVLAGLSIASAGTFAASILLPVPAFLLVLWTVSTAAAAVIVFLLGRILVMTGSPVAVWYLLSWGYTLAGVLSEIVAAAFGVRFSIDVLNNVTGAIVSSLFVTVAIAERLHDEQKQKNSAKSQAVAVLRQFRETYASMPIGLFTMDLSGRLTQCNPAFARMLRLAEPADGQPAARIPDAAGRMQFERLLERSGKQALAEIEFATHLDASRPRWLLAQASRKGNCIEGSVQDITERKAAERRLQHLADHDSLTDLLNRRGLERALDAAIAEVGSGAAACLGYLDLDRFKLVNDLFGHAAGDQVLRLVAEHLRSVLREPHVIARIGGDEFVFLLNGCSPPAARVLGEAVLRSIDCAPLQFANKAFNVTGCIGIIGLHETLSVNDALTASDRACAAAKRRGGSQLVIYDEQDGQLKRQLEEIHWEAAMRHQLPIEHFFVQMQPIVHLQAAHASLNYEVLLRMRGDDGSLVPLDRLIGAAERNGMMADLDRWVLGHVLEWLDAHPAHLERLGFASVNLSGASLNDERFVEDAVALVRAHPRAAARLCFEITEGVALYDVDNTRRFVHRVKSFNAKVALDDFGAGYTSFGYLKDLSADIVKIDGAFVRGLASQSENRAITRAIVELSHQIGMSVVAEWAETPEVVEMLIGMGVDYGQGYGLVRPLSADLLVGASSAGALVSDARVAALLGRSAQADRARASHEAALG